MQEINIDMILIYSISNYYFIGFDFNFIEYISNRAFNFVRIIFSPHLTISLMVKLSKNSKFINLRL